MQETGRQQGYVELWGAVRAQTRDAVLFQIEREQPAGVPDEARGLWLWFPRRGTHCFRDRAGHLTLSVPRALLADKLAPKPPAPAPAPARPAQIPMAFDQAVA